MDEERRGGVLNIADTLQQLGEELGERLRWLSGEEGRLRGELAELVDARLRQEGAVDCLRLVAKRLADSTPLGVDG